jgi:peroxiredoxin/tetratricopeptide (TPR) repeat protein
MNDNNCVVLQNASTIDGPTITRLMSSRILIIVVLPLVLTSFSALAEDANDEILPGHSLHGETFNEGPRQKAYLMENTGNVSFPITSKHPEAQAFFNQGVGQLHGFWYFEAERSFRHVLYLDPTCPMAYWGLAMANVNNGERAKDFIAETEESLESKKLTDREKRYMKALHHFYHGGEKDRGKRHRQLLREYERIALDFSDDLEARALAAYQVWFNNRKGVPISSHLSTDALIQQVLDAKPMHPVHHFKIHLWDYEKPERALPSAARCGQSAPNIAHMWHMPGHTYSKAHRYEDAVFQQAASARVDHAHMMRDRVMPHQIHNYAHNNGWCAENLGYLGEIDEAIKLAMNLIELPRKAKFKKLGEQEYYDAGGSGFREGRRRLWALLNDYALWDEMLRLSETMYLMPTDDPLMQAERLRYRGVAYFSKGDVDSGKNEMEELRELLDALKSRRDTAENQARTKFEEEQSMKEDKEDDEKDQKKAEKKRNEALEKAEKSARLPFDSIVKASESYIGQLEAHLAVLIERPEAAREKVEKAKGFLAIDRARLYTKLANWEKAEEILKREVDGKRNPVVMLSQYVRVLKKLGRKNEVKTHMKSLRTLAATADLMSPPMQALAEIAEDQELPEDWRLPRDKPDDLIERPNLHDLGPLHWAPTAAPDFRLPRADGAEIVLTETTGKTKLVIFYLGQKCVHCMEQLNAFAPLAERYAEAGIEVIAVSTDSMEGLKTTFSTTDDEDGENPFPFPLVSDVDLNAFKDFRAYDEFEDVALHGTFLIDGDQQVRWQDVSYEPFMHPKWLLEEAQRLLDMDNVETVLANRNVEQDSKL